MAKNIINISFVFVSKYIIQPLQCDSEQEPVTEAVRRNLTIINVIIHKFLLFHSSLCLMKFNVHFSSQYISHDMHCGQSRSIYTATYSYISLIHC